MKSNVFKLIYNHPLLKSENYEEIEMAHTCIEISQNELLLEIGKTANEFYLIEQGLFRSFLLAKV